MLYCYICYIVSFLMGKRIILYPYIFDFAFNSFSIFISIDCESFILVSINLIHNNVIWWLYLKLISWMIISTIFYVFLFQFLNLFESFNNELFAFKTIRACIPGSPKLLSKRRERRTKTIVHDLGSHYTDWSFIAKLSPSPSWLA